MISELILHSNICNLYTLQCKIRRVALLCTPRNALPPKSSVGYEKNKWAYSHAHETFPSASHGFTRGGKVPFRDGCCPAADKPDSSDWVRSSVHLGCRVRDPETRLALGKRSCLSQSEPQALRLESQTSGHSHVGRPQGQQRHSASRRERWQGDSWVSVSVWGTLLFPGLGAAAALEGPL